MGQLNLLLVSSLLLFYYFEVLYCNMGICFNFEVFYCCCTAFHLLLAFHPLHCTPLLQKGRRNLLEQLLSITGNKLSAAAEEVVIAKYAMGLMPMA